MIKHLNYKNYIDLFDFLSCTNDRYEDFYVTIDKERKFLKNNWYLIKKVLHKHECYGLVDKGFNGIIMIVRDKGFRPYVKLLTKSSKYNIDLLKFLKWNFSEIDLYFKLKKDNPLSEQIKRTGFIKVGDRGREILFFKKGIKPLYKVVAKDEYENKKTDSKLY
jgi:hypothetical protein